MPQNSTMTSGFGLGVNELFDLFHMNLDKRIAYCVFRFGSLRNTQYVIATKVQLK